MVSNSGQKSHVLDPDTLEKRRIPQGKHSLFEIPLLNWPGSQLSQALPFEYVPSPHLSHTLLPVLFAIVPGSHGLASVLPVGHAHPAGHDEQSL